MAVDIQRPRVFGAGVGLGVLAGILIGTAVTYWLGDAAVTLIQRLLDRILGRRDTPRFDLFLQ